jgi:hypothetical protein
MRLGLCVLEVQNDAVSQTRQNRRLPELIGLHQTAIGKGRHALKLRWQSWIGFDLYLHVAKRILPID